MLFKRGESFLIIIDKDNNKKLYLNGDIFLLSIDINNNIENPFNIKLDNNLDFENFSSLIQRREIFT